MSKFLDIADAMKTAIESVVETTDIKVVVDRQSNLQSHFDQHIGKVKAGVAIIKFNSSSSTSDDAEGPRMNGKYTITIVGYAVLRAGKTLLDDIVETICKKLHHWKDVTTNHCQNEAYVTNLQVVEDGKHIAYQISLKKVIQL
jgi:hypothetical protein